MRVLFLLPLWVSFCFGCSPTWQENRDSHEPSDVTSNPFTLRYLAETLRDDAKFDATLQAILLERPMLSEGHSSVESYIEDSLFSLGWSIEIDAFVDSTPWGDVEFRNIMAHLNPESPRRLVLACHYDSLATVDGFVGAIDAAVPCAYLLDLASTMTPILRQLTTAELSITLLFFDGEEGLVSFTSTDGTYGSRHLAQQWDDNSYDVGSSGELCQNEPADFLDRMDLLFLMDLIGTPDPNFQSIQFDGSSGVSKYYAMMMDIEEAMDFFIPVDTKPMFNGVIGYDSVADDHVPFRDAGMRRIFYLITRPFPSVWHTTNDNLDALDFGYVYRFNALLRVWVAQYMGF